MGYQSVFRPGMFAGQTIIVTGGGSGIGRCTAHELASLDAHVALIGRTAEKLEPHGRSQPFEGFHRAQPPELLREQG